jgi:bifunctional non-homologous end joining protein LigD
MHVRNERRARELAERHPVTFMAFDVLRLYGVDLLTMPLDERRAALGRVDLPGATGGLRWQVPPHYDDGAVLAAATLEQGLEGVVSKKRKSPYRPGRRSPDWVKTAHHRTQTCVVGGWVPQVGTQHVGSLYVGLPAGDGRLTLLGRVGSGLTGALATQLERGLKPLEQKESPFTERPVDPDVRLARWVRPQVCVEVRYLGLREGGRLRQPVLRGLRADVKAEEVVREP